MGKTKTIKVSFKLEIPKTMYRPEMMAWIRGCAWSITRRSKVTDLKVEYVKEKP